MVKEITRRNTAVAPTRTCCQDCRDVGYHRLAGREFPGSAALVLAALLNGEIALCTCDQGQWWLDWLYECFGSIQDANGNEIGNPDLRLDRGVPDNLVHRGAA